MGKVLPYREIAEPGLVLVERSRPRGLVRANGSECRCVAPGRIWRWWFDVQVGDRWYCKHGGGWRFRTHHGTPRFYDHWEALQPESAADE